MTCYTLYTMNSKLQIISGRFRGRKLNLPTDARPTQNKARQALFNMLYDVLPDITNKKLLIWDAFAGSGAFGLECISRFDNVNVLFTDIADSSLNTVKKNAAMLGLKDQAKIQKADALQKIPDLAPIADIIFIDPPYNQSNLGADFVCQASILMKKGSLLIWEQEKDNFTSPEKIDEFKLLKDKSYGRARFLILVKS